MGFGFAVQSPDRQVDLEQGLVFASRAMMDEGDLRVGSLLVLWLEVHGQRVLVDRLRRMIAHESDRVAALWSSVGRVSKPLDGVAAAGGLSVDLLPTGTEFQLRRRGPDPRFEGCVLRVPDGVLRVRAQDIESPRALASQHRGYALRVQMGATWRAEIWTRLERTPGLSVAQLAHQTGSSYAAAWGTVSDYRLLDEAKRLSSSQRASRKGTQEPNLIPEHKRSYAD